MNERLQAVRAAVSRHAEHSEASRRTQRRPQRDDVGKTMPTYVILSVAKNLARLRNTPWSTEDETVRTHVILSVAKNLTGLRNARPCGVWFLRVTGE